jgi:eukaryotic-like serine/threonine-protein kinase
MSQPHPNKSDAVLGGQVPPPINAAVLGGRIGRNQNLAREFGWSYELVEELTRTHDVFSFEAETVNNKGKTILRIKNKVFHYVENLGNGVSLEMVYIPVGSFLMGYQNSDQELVYLPSFHISKYPITQEQYQAIIGTNPAYFNSTYFKRFASTDLRRHANVNKLPVEQIQWPDTQDFCRKLSERTGKEYKLPNENQWEYACRAGTQTPFHFGDTITTNLANFCGYCSAYAQEPSGLVYREQTTTVGTFSPNNFGLYDMHGNVWEWCEDSHPGKDKRQPINGAAQVWDGEEKNNFLKGGAWNSQNYSCASAERFSFTTSISCHQGRINNIGFRVVY